MGPQAQFRKGLLLGASAALLWAISRQVRHPAQRRMLDWGWVTQIAIRASGTAPSLHPLARQRLEDDYRGMVREIEEPIAAYTGTSLSLANTVVRVMDRRDWIHANVANFRQVFAPIEQAYAESRSAELMDLPGVSQAGRAVLSAQVGLLLGLFAQRVLGQYDMSLLGKEPLEAGQLYFVEPNIEGLGRQLRLPGQELRKWIALHEATHAHEFELHPWVRAYFNSTLESYLRSVVDEMRERGSGLGRISGRLWRNVRRGESLLHAMMTPHQRHLLSRLQALMSLAEGYSNHIMHSVGQQVLGHYDEIKTRIEQRQKRRSRAELLFFRLTGLSLKMEQYALGEAFVNYVVRERGITFVNRAWSAVESLPTEQEIREPARWIQRIEQQ